MHTAVTKNLSNISGFRVRFLATKLASSSVLAAFTAAVFCALFIFTSLPAQAQTETVLYRFPKGGLNGKTPQSHLTSDGKGNIFGTTNDGGLWGYGTVFELSPDGGHGHRSWKESVLYNFTGGADGQWPLYSPLILDSAGNLYGTTYYGGAYGEGTVFELSPTGTSWTETVLHSFGNGTDSMNPADGVIMDQAGNLYGTTIWGGASGNGTIFELSPAGSDWTWQVIYSFETYHYAVISGLTMDVAGNIFGATYSTVYELSPDGTGGWHSTVLHTFAGLRAGHGLESAPVFDNAGNLYVTTVWGGTNNAGTVYRLSPGHNGTWNGKSLHSFKGGNDGATPWAEVTLDATGNIYGTTLSGGTYNEGTVFRLVPRVGAATYKEQVLYSFHGEYGSTPYGGLILNNEGNLYGATSGGGNGIGAVFELTP